MGLFGKKQEAKAELPPLRFPELPKSVPTFEAGPGPSEMAQIKSAVSPMPVMPATAPMMMEPSMSMPGSEQPLFVKIEKYRDVVETLKRIKGRLHEADEILNKLTRLKEEEDRELQAWHADLERIRNQLLDVDKKLFE